MYKLFSLFRTLSMAIFLAALVYTYSFLPEKALLYSQGENQWHVEKAHFFYASLAIFFILNSLLYAMVFLLKKRFSFLAMSMNMAMWTNGMMGFLNLFLSLSVVALGAANKGMSAFHVGSLIYGGVAMLAVWLFSFYYFRKQETIS